MITASNLTKVFGTVTAIDDVSFHVRLRHEPLPLEEIFLRLVHQHREPQS